MRSSAGPGPTAARWLPLALLALALLSSCRRTVIPEALSTEPAGEPPAHRQSPIRFRDVAAAAGIHFHHVNGAAGELNLPETMGSGCAFLDYDNDGWLDIFLVNSRRLAPGAASATSHPGLGSPLDADQKAPTCALYRNSGDGTFADVTAGSGLERAFFGMGCAVGDYDADGDPDIYVTAALDGSRLFRNEGRGRFRDVADLAGVRSRDRWGTSAAWLDYDRDGRLDLFVCNYIRYRWGDDRTCPLPETHRTYCNPNSFPPETCSLYRNLGNGRFRDVSRSAGISSATGKALGVLVLDVERDGWPDVAVACDTTRNLLFRNRAGRFVEEAVRLGTAFGENGSPRAGMGIDAAYVRNDERLAILVSNFTNEGLSFFTQRGPTSAFLDTSGGAGFAASSRLFLGFGLAFLDLDNDTLRDAVVVNGHVDPWIGDHTAVSYAERHLLYRNEGAGRFAEIGAGAGEAFRQLRVSRGLAVGDYDRDGRLDLLVSNNGGSAELLRNESSTPGHWIQLRLQGKRGDRCGLGAFVRVEAGGISQTDWLRSGSSYCSQNSPILHFGLGTAAKVERLEVRWASGAVDRHRNLAADRRYSLTEGERAAPAE